jgi:acyl-CoA reductase-like NAD-dependent aldehyde dehydrogenase
MNSQPSVSTREVSPFLDGAFAKSSSDATFQEINPSNGRPSLTVPKGSDADVDRAVASARRAFEDGRWSDMPLSARKKTLHRFADLIEAEGPALDAFDAAEMGKPVSIEFCNAAAAGGLVRFHAEAIDKVLGDVFPGDKQTFAVQRKVPRGVVGAIVPWNFPAFCALLKVAPALAAGNCVVLKPSEMSSRSALRLAELAIQAGVPPGVMNVVPGLGETVGRALGLHRDVDMLTFTGSTEVGKLMMQYSGQSNLKVVMAECGGKSPQIIFDDGVDLDSAADAVATDLLMNQGQLCSVGSRLLVQRSIEARVLEKIADRFKQIVMGDALDPKTTFGPLVSAKQCARVMQYINTATTQGARLVIGGNRALQESGGYFVEPTMFRDVASTSRIAQEEIFGPVLSVISFSDAAEAIRIANGTMYGLWANVWTANLSTGMIMAKGIHSSVAINAAPPKSEGAGYAFSTEPFGASGIGSESGLVGMESYLRRHSIWFNHT